MVKEEEAGKYEVSNLRLKGQFYSKGGYYIVSNQEYFSSSFFDFKDDKSIYRLVRNLRVFYKSSKLLSISLHVTFTI